MSGVEFLPHRAAPADPSPPEPATALPLDDDDMVAMPPPRRYRRGLGARSLTARIVSGVVALVIVLVVAIGGGTYYALKSSLGDRLDQQLQTTAGGQSLRTLLNGGGGPGVRAPQSVWLVALDPTGKTSPIYPAGYGIRSMTLSSSERSKLANRMTAVPMTVTTSDHVELRITTRQVTVLQTGQQATLVIGLSTEDERKTLTKLVNLELLIGAAAILVALLATLSGVRFSLRRLRRVTTTANEVAAELSPTGAGLDRRVDVPNDGTEVGQLAESMNTLLAAVETQFAQRLESEDRLRQFLADASHELRTPLTSIRGYAELARMQRDAGANADDNLSRIESEGTRMSRLVEDLLTLARGDQSSAPRQELVDVAELLDEAVSSARVAFPNRPIDVQLTAGLHVVGDRDQLYRIVRNLIGNADMHTAPGRPVLVRCVADADNAVIQVIDSGPGLPPEEAAHVFERFWRADKARSRARGGTGLGLSIVAAMVAAHGGTVRFDSSVEHGSTVTVSLPAVSV
jgi:two-component system OmpR family sensor kinase